MSGIAYEMDDWQADEEAVALARIVHPFISPRAEWFQQQAEQALEDGDVYGAEQASYDASFALAGRTRVF